LGKDVRVCQGRLSGGGSSGGVSRLGGIGSIGVGALSGKRLSGSGNSVSLLSVSGSFWFARFIYSTSFNSQSQAFGTVDCHTSFISCG
jgi:hypothetical protein